MMEAKLGDFGAARLRDAGLSVGPMSPPYTAPERLEIGSPRKSKETDMYSTGVSICQLFTGAPPEDKHEKRVLQIQDIGNEEVKSLCNQLLQNDPQRRPNATKALTVIGDLRKTEGYKKCPPRRIVKGKPDGVPKGVILTDQMC